MAELILAASNAARNKVSKFIRAFKCVLKYLADKSSNCEISNNYWRAIGILIDFGYEAVKENGICIHIESYQKNLRSYIYHSSIFPENASKLNIEPEALSLIIAQNLSNMLLLAEKSFANLNHSSYYKDFVHAVKMLIEDYKDARVKHKTLLS